MQLCRDIAGQTAAVVSEVVFVSVLQEWLPLARVTPHDVQGQRWLDLSHEYEQTARQTNQVTIDVCRAMRHLLCYNISSKCS